MLITDIQDISSIEEIHDGSFFLPDINSRLIISKKMAIADGKLIGACFSRITAEGILVLDKTAPLLTRARVAGELITTLKEEGKQRGLEDCHVFVKDHRVQKFLRRFGFDDCKGGQPMVVFL